jgi:hypothetical protein
MTHILIVKSLRDTIANCSCGRWNYSAPTSADDTDAELCNRVTEQFRLHAGDGPTPDDRKQLLEDMAFLLRLVDRADESFPCGWLERDESLRLAPIRAFLEREAGYPKIKEPDDR